MPVIAAILFTVAYNMSEWREFVGICKTSPKSDILVLVITFLLTVIFDLVVAICVGFVLATILFMKRMSDVTEVQGWKYDEDNDKDHIRFKKVPENTLVYEITGPMFFGASDKMREVIKDAKNCNLILRMRSVPAVDATALHTFENILKICKEKNIKLIMSHVNQQPMDTLKKSGIYDEIGEENFCANIDEALQKAETK